MRPLRGNGQHNRAAAEVEVMSERRLAHRGVRPQRSAWVGDVDPLRRYVEETNNVCLC
jgi:hypothetical protein